ncbi:MAG: DUF937 domain-containing protein [Firmicutes bacterium]|nr:DUF937 domain-containing protein [Bacillota bacterium]
MNLLSILLKSMMTDNSINTMSQKTGLGAKQLRKLLPLAIPLLLKFMTKNASSQAGASSLLSALTQHTNNKPVSQQIAEADTVDGGKILAHILGNNSQASLDDLANQTGMSQQEVLSALSSITPAMLSGLSAATNASANTASAAASTAATQTASAAAASQIDLSDGLDMKELMSLLGGSQPQVQQKPQSGGLLSALFGRKPTQTAAPAESDNMINGTALLQALLSNR